MALFFVFQSLLVQENRINKKREKSTLGSPEHMCREHYLYNSITLFKSVNNLNL